MQRYTIDLIAYVEYKEDTQQIPVNTNIIVTRVPKRRSGRSGTIPAIPAVTSTETTGNTPSTTPEDVGEANINAFLAFNAACAARFAKHRLSFLTMSRFSVMDGAVALLL